MSVVRPLAAMEPSRTLRIPRACSTPSCGAVYYVAAVTDAAICPACGTYLHGYSLSA